MKLFASVMICLTTANLYSLSDGAFNMTGAPGEPDCSACHSGAAVNSDPKGMLSIEVDSSNGFYVPGKSYPVKVTISYTGKSRFGFALNTRQPGSNLHVGSFIAASNSGVVNRTEYVAHSKASTNAPNQKTWSFRWVAPATTTGDVSIYAAGVVSNGDNDNTGDLVYTTSIKLKKSGSTGVSAPGSIPASIVAYPVPATNTVWLKDLDPSIIEEALLINTSGKQVYAFSPADFEGEHNQAKLHLDPALPGGTYLLRIQYGQQILFAKILLL